MAMDAREFRVEIRGDADIVMARKAGRELGVAAGLSGSDLTLIATAISEIARNILSYARSGEMIISAQDEPGRRGLLVVARDEGPGIADVNLALQDGYSTGKSLGLGLPGARRLMDEFEIVSQVGKGVTVTMRKWAR
jgi:serine/threonine-protein kinase RsbT